MIVKSPELPIVQIGEYHYVFVDGTTTTIYVNAALGDTVDRSQPNVIKFNLVGKPDRLNPAEMLAPEEISVFMGHVLIESYKVHQETQVSLEERTALRETIDLLASPGWKTPQ